MKNPTPNPGPKVAMSLGTGIGMERTNLVDVDKMCRWFRKILTTFLGPLEASDVTQVGIEVDIDSPRAEYKRSISTTIAEIHAAVKNELKEVGKNIDVIVNWFRSLISTMNAGIGATSDVDVNTQYFGTMYDDSLSVSFDDAILHRKEVHSLSNTSLTEEFASGGTFTKAPTTAAETLLEQPIRPSEDRYFTSGRRRLALQEDSIEIVDTGPGFIEIKIAAPFGGWSVGERVLLYRGSGTDMTIFESHRRGRKAIISLRPRPDPR